METTMVVRSIADVEARLQAMEDRDLAGTETDDDFVYPYESPTSELTPAAWAGVNRLLDEYASIQSGAAALVAFTGDSRRVAAWVVAALEERGALCAAMPMKTLVDASLPRRLSTVLASFDAGEPLTIFTFEAHTMSHGKIFRHELANAGLAYAQVFRATSAGENLFAQALSVGPGELHARNLALLSHFQKAETIQVTTPAGTDLHIEFDHDTYRWINNSGVWRPGSFTVLPAGEVATFPGSINGRLVADFAIHANVPMDIDTRLDKTPVTVDIADGQVVNLHSNSRDLAYLLSEWFGSTNGNRVGELGFGTNIGITHSVPGNSNVNERYPGIHLGIGQHNQSTDVVEYSAYTHADLIAFGGMVSCDGAAPIDLHGPIPPLGGVMNLDYRSEDVLSAE